MTLRRFNNLLSVVVVLLGLYIAVTPFIPELTFLLRDSSPDAIAPYGGDLAGTVGGDTKSAPPEDNRLVIPSIGLNEPIFESNYISAIANGGTWHRPNTVTPNEVGNSVIVGHRFYGSHVSTFYHLDKLTEGEVFAVYWDKKELLYRVSDIRVVEPSELSVEAPTDDRRLTLYTCTPLWTSAKRLVIVAEPIEDNLKPVGAES